MNIHIYYRISDAGYNKVKPDYINNENCLRNAVQMFPLNKVRWNVMADNVSEQTSDMICKYVPKSVVEYVSVGHGAGTFKKTLEQSLELPSEDIVYFLENDYLHREDALEALLDGFTTGAQYVSLYDHPDKYLSPQEGGNPFVESGGELTRVLKGKMCHWKMTNSTTMTFASMVRTLKNDYDKMLPYISDNHPDDFQMFLKLREHGRALVTPLPGYSTHGETRWLSPFVDWKTCVK